jgi:hemoglobin-like flavoprotein
MTPDQVKLIRDSFAKLSGDVDGVAAAFYAKLFEIDPSLRPLFKGDMRSQGRKLMGMLATAVRSLDALESVLPAIQSLGKRHVDYGVADKDYATVGTALIDTLAAGLKDEFTTDVRLAWLAAYTALSKVMIDAAHTP